MHERGWRAAPKARARAYRRYAEELRATAHVLSSPEAREILQKTADDYERMAASIAKMSERPGEREPPSAPQL